MFGNNKGFFIGLAVFSLVLIIGLVNAIPESLASLDGKNLILKIKFSMLIANQHGLF